MQLAGEIATTHEMVEQHRENFLDLHRRRFGDGFRDPFAEADALETRRLHDELVHEDRLWEQRRKECVLRCSLCFVFGCLPCLVFLPVLPALEKKGKRGGGNVVPSIVPRYGLHAFALRTSHNDTQARN